MGQETDELKLKAKEQLSEAKLMITKQTGISIGLAVTVLGCAVYLDRRLVTIEMECQSIQSRLDNATAHRWTSRNMQMWTELLKAKNPALEMPVVQVGGE